MPKTIKKTEKAEIVEQGSIISQFADLTPNERISTINRLIELAQIDRERMAQGEDPGNDHYLKA